MKKFVIIIFCILSITGCGFFSDEKPKNSEVYEVGEVCVLDPDAFDNILKKDINVQLACLEENFNLFLNAVRTKDRNVITEYDLSRFIRKFFNTNSETIIKSINLFFQINMILLNDQMNKISRNNIKPIFKLISTANRESVVLYKIFSDVNNENAWKMRKLLVGSIYNLKRTVLKIIAKTGGPTNKLNLVEFVEELNRKFPSMTISQELTDSIPFIKKLLIGGEPDTITNSEISILVSKIPSIAVLAFDLFFLKENHFKNKNQFLRFYLKKLKQIVNIIAPARHDEILFEHDNIMNIVKTFLKEDRPDEKKDKSIDIDLISILLKTVKPMIVGGDAMRYTYSDLKKIMGHIIDFSELHFFNSVTWEHYSDVLKKNRRLRNLKQLDPKIYKVLSNARVKELHENFVDIVKKYRFFRKENGMQYYIHEYRRNLPSFMEMSYFRWGFEILGKNYTVDEGTINIDMKNIERLLWDFRPLLEYYGLWSTMPETFARNTMLLGDLFQNQSNGDLKLNKDEGSEYFILVTNAIKVKEQVTTELKKVCEYGDDDSPEIPVSCFRKNIPSILFEKLGYQEYMPELYKYRQKQGNKEFSSFLKHVEYFARDIPDDTIPIHQRDMVLILGALLNIESTFIRFDINRSNILEPEELDTAFLTYKNAITTLALDMGSDPDGYEKSIFLYLVKYMEMPTPAQLVWFHYSPNFIVNKRFEAKRVSVGSILYNLVKGSKEAHNKSNRPLPSHKPPSTKELYKILFLRSPDLI